MELFRSLAVLSEAPSPESETAAAALELGSLPSRSEFTDLFAFQLYPYASVYLGDEGMMGGEARDRIAGFWRALGETPPPEPDHLAVLLAAYAELADRQAGSGDDEERRRWRHARSAFLWEHLLSWLPVYLDKVGEIGSEFYRTWSGTLLAALLEEAAGYRAPEQAPLHLREALSLDQLEDAGADDFLKAVLTPVRTGMILVRSDLERCARGLGLGLRKGERRYVLKALLGQATREILVWLADEADRWAERHGARDESLRAVSSFWERRARKSSHLLRESMAKLSFADGDA